MNRQIFYHVGLSKTASTYLQNRFFPKLDGIEYISTHKYKNYKQLVNSSKSDKILLSREFDQQFYIETKRISQDFGRDTKIIIVFRRHDSWIASQYRRYVKNGGTKSFTEFFDVKNNKGLWKTEDALFFPMLKFITENFNSTPLVLFYEDLKKYPFDFLDKIAKYTASTYDETAVNLSSKHKSYSEKQLKFLRKYCKIFKNDFPSQKYLAYRSRWLICHFMLFAGNILPETDKNPLINPKDLEDVRVFFDDDWKKIKNFKNSI